MQPSETAAAPPLVEATRWLAVASLLALIVLQLAWHLWLPARPSLRVVLALPLCVPLAGLLKRQMYTYRWTSLLVWLYFTEGAVRATSERGLGAALAGVEVLLSLSLFAACLLQVRTQTQTSKERTA